MTKEQFVSDVVIFGDKMFRIALRLLENPDSAKDVIQETYLKLWEKRNEISRFRSIEAYAITIVKNKCLDKLRLVKQNVDIKSIKTASQRPDLEYEQKESANEIEKIIRTLPKQQKTIIQLRDIEGLAYEEIAELLDMSVNNIRVHLSYARKKIKEELDKTYNYGLYGHQ
jgi:RNA polymerase sigma factor (sigma-70 family)